MAKADLGLGPPLRHEYRAGGGGTAGFLLDLKSLGRLRVEGDWTGYPLGDDRSRRRLWAAYSLPLSKRASLRLSWERQPPRQEGGASLALYY